MHRGALRPCQPDAAEIHCGSAVSERSFSLEDRELVHTLVRILIEIEQQFVGIVRLENADSTGECHPAGRVVLARTCFWSLFVHLCPARALLANSRNYRRTGARPGSTT